MVQIRSTDSKVRVIRTNAISLVVETLDSRTFLLFIKIAVTTPTDKVGLPPVYLPRFYDDARSVPRYYAIPDPFIEDLLRAEFSKPFTVRRLVIHDIDIALATARLLKSLAISSKDADLSLPVVLSSFIPANDEEYKRYLLDTVGEL